MRPNFPYEFTPEQMGRMLPYKKTLGEISETVEWLRYSILHDYRQDFLTTLKDLRCQLAELEAIFSNSNSPGAEDTESIV